MYNSLDNKKYRYKRYNRILQKMRSYLDEMIPRNYNLINYE